MIQPADIREWRDRDVVDDEGRKIGALESVYVSTSTDQPEMATVRTGVPTRHRLVFVPVDDAIVGPGYVKVAYARALVKKAPSLGVDDVLPADEEGAIFQYYGKAYTAGVGGQRRLARR